MRDSLLHLRKRLSKRRCLGLVGLLIIASCGGVAAHAQRLLVVTNTLSATREASRVYVHSIDFDTGGVLPGALPLPGATPLGPLLTPAQGPALLSTGPVMKGSVSDSRHARTWHTVFQVAPFTELPRQRRVSETQWREWISCALEDPRSGDTIAVAPGVRAASDADWQARLTTLVYPRRDGGEVHRGPVTYGLPGWPLMAAHGGDGRVYVLCRTTPETGLHLLLGDALSPGLDFVSVPVCAEMEQPGLAAAGMGVDADMGLVLVVASGYALDRPGGEPVSHACLVRTRDGTAPGAAIDIRGEGSVESPVVCPAGGGLFWIVTRVPGTEFAYVTRLRATAEGALSKEAEYAIAGASRGLLAAAAPDEDALAVGFGNRLEIWRDGKRNGTAHDYPSRIQALCWSEEGLFAGSGGSVHRVDRATAQPMKTVLLQSGHVTGLMVIPRRRLPAIDADGDGLSPAAERLAGTSDQTPDTDGDGIPDGSDPEPADSSPQLEVPAEVLFQGKAVGHEIHALDFRVRYGENATWRVEPDADARDWLVITPRSGRVPGQAYLAVNPLAYMRGAALEGAVQVSMTSGSPAVQAAGSPAEVLVRVLPASAGARRALWLWSGLTLASLRGGPEPHEAGTLAELLAGPPFFFSHTVSEGPFQDALSDYSMVILDARAAAQGAVTRQGLLDYVMEGGALLFLGAYLDDRETRPLTHWLAPLGIRIDTDARVDRKIADFAVGARETEMHAVSSASPDEFLGRHWRAFAIESGCALQAPESCVIVRDTHDPDLALLTACRYGYGRIALLASASPLCGAVLERPDNRRFAEDLMQWLSLAGTDISDMDGDGLPDGVEDRNDNGGWDAGETNYLQADTDSDGISDALEDLNRNGALDDGETDPRNRDSDGDGVYDGADDSPCPAIGAPQIIAVEGTAGPAEGPAEGGTTIIISGRNFPPAATVWFGDRQAPVSRVHGASTILAVTPPCADAQGGPVAVRVVTQEGGAVGAATEAVLADGFRYGPRTRVRLVLTPVGPARRSGNRYEGELRAVLEAPGAAIVRQVVALLRPETTAGFVWRTTQHADGDAARRLFWNMRVLENGLLLLHSRTAARAARGPGLAVDIPWACTADANTPARIRVDVSGLLVTHWNGVPLDASSEGAVIVLEEAQGPTPTRTEQGRSEANILAPRAGIEPAFKP